jgi:Predicted membrane protein (DUF2127)
MARWASGASALPGKTRLLKQCRGVTMATDDAGRTRFRRPLGLLIIGYKAALGLTEIVVGSLLAIPKFNPQATFARLAAEELREDPSDHFVALVTRHLPSLLHHRGPVATGVILLGLAKLVAAAAMWEGQEWGGYLLAITVAVLLPLDLAKPSSTPPRATCCWQQPTWPSLWP